MNLHIKENDRLFKSKYNRSRPFGCEFDRSKFHKYKRNKCQFYECDDYECHFQKHPYHRRKY